MTSQTMTAESRVLFTKTEFNRLFSDYYQTICNFIYSQTKDWHSSEEIAQKTFVKLWDKRKTININSSIKSYLYQSARNTMIDEYRKSKYRQRFSDNYVEEGENNDYVDVDDFQEEYRKLQMLDWAIDQLKPKQKQIFRLNKQEGLTYDEISTYLGIPKRTVEYNMKVALTKIKERLQKVNIF